MLTLAWSDILADNARLMAMAIPPKKGSGKTKWQARLFTAPEYREAKERAAVSLAEQWARIWFPDPSPLLEGPLELTGTLYFPDRRARDVANYSKLICDALTGVAYTDDSQLQRVTWALGGIVGRDAARAEITVRLLKGGRLVGAAATTTQATLGF